MREDFPPSAVERVEAYLAGRNGSLLAAEDIAASLNLEVGEVRCALRELESDGLLDKGDEEGF